MSGGEIKSNCQVMTMCAVKNSYVNIGDDKRCTACGELVEEPFKGNEHHQSSFTADALRTILSQGPAEIINMRTGERTFVGGANQGGENETDAVN